MAGTISNYQAGRLLQHMMSISAYTPEGTLYLGLCTSDPGVTGDDSGELATASYARQALSPTYDVGTPRAVAFDADVVFPVATEAWSSITHWAIFDAETAGNILYSGRLLDYADAPVTITASIGDQVKLPQAELSVDLA